MLLHLVSSSPSPNCDDVFPVLVSARTTEKKKRRKRKEKMINIEK